MRRLGAILAATLISVSVAACGDTATDPPSEQDKAADAVYKKSKKQKAYIPRNDVELDNYNAAQRLYDDPANVLWCTFAFSNPSAPLVTVPVAGKLTSSSTTYFAPVELAGGYSDDTALPSRSVDGLFHPDPPKYRYGFTPGGTYADFFNTETYCSSKPTKFQRQNTKVSLSVDPGLNSADKAAQAALRNGNKAEAERILNKAIGG